MIQTVNNSDFHYAFNRMDRGSQFSYEALNLIYEYLEQFEEQTGEQIELDVIAICCDYSEMTPSEVLDAYETEIDLNCDNLLDEVFEWLNNKSAAIGITQQGTIVFQQF
jgi:hypothetical protein